MSKFKQSVSALLLAAACAAPRDAQIVRTRADAVRRGTRAPLVILDGTRETDGLKGPVRRVETEVVKVEVRQGQPLAHPPSLLERTLYDVRGRRAQNETYPMAGGRTGQETHRYDARGNLVETIVRDAGGAALSRTTYEYEFDEHGNWIKMTASVAVSNRGRAEYEPFEITSRSITYYAVDEAGGRAAQNAAPASLIAAGEKVGERASAGESAEAVAPAAASTTALGHEPAEISVMSDGGMFDAGVLNARATWLPPPAFPVGRKRLETPITVAVEVTLDITGRVVGARAQNGPPALRDSAERAASLAAFPPFYVSGRPVPAKGIINYNFNYLP